MDQATALVVSKLHVVDEAKQFAGECAGHVLLIGIADITTQYFYNFFDLQQRFAAHRRQYGERGHGVFVGRRGFTADAIRGAWARCQLAILQARWGACF